MIALRIRSMPVHVLKRGEVMATKDVINWERWNSKRIVKTPLAGLVARHGIY